MKIVNKKQLAELPNYTLFAPYTPYIIGEYSIKTGNLKYSDGTPGWNGELPLCPFLDIEEKYTDHKSNIIATNWSTIDNADIDYDDDQLFAVFSKLEVLQIIKCLMLSFTDGKEGIDMDAWFGFDNIIEEE